MSLHPAVLQSPTTPLALDVSRYKLKELAHWIRDDLDILVARDGPDVLRPDDVLTLHDLFVALRHSTTVTALDLRATGIHRAVKDIAGIATRWPTRLCDDCDQIIAIWTTKFGLFDELRPFLFGRGGRLEGIASVSDYSREALLKRWSEHCPDKIHHNVSHRSGSLGFKAGDWWINSLFAHHAGIIGLESVEGGTTYDKNGAYALVLKDRGEIDVQSDETLVYRCPIDDKGKFRLTAATPSSRGPIRVLRSHSINSIWGPRAGIRFEGLCFVKGWCIRQPKLKDLASGEWREGDIIYEVILQRRDPVPVDEVARRPTNMEVDDYAEYKRLQKLHREYRRNGSGPITLPQQILKAAPPIPPLPTSSTPQSLLRLSPNSSRVTTFIEPDFDTSRAKLDMEQSPNFDVVSPLTNPDMLEPAFKSKHNSSLAIPTAIPRLKAGSKASSGATTPKKGVWTASPDAASLNSSAISVTEELKEILPWIELEAELPTPPTFTVPLAMRRLSISGSVERIEKRAAEMNPVKSVRRLARDSQQLHHSDLQSRKAYDEDAATDALNLRLYSAKSVRPTLRKKKEKERETEKEKEKKRLTFGMKARFFDGAEYSADDEDDGHTALSRSWHSRSSSVDFQPQLYSPRPVRPLIPNSIFDYGIERIEFASPLDDIVPRPMAAPPVDSPVNMSPRDGLLAGGESIALGKLKRWLSR